MRDFWRKVGVALVAVTGLGLIYWPLVSESSQFVVVRGRLLNKESLERLLPGFLATAAVVAAIYSSFSRQDRLRASTENVLISLLAFLISVLLISVGIIFLHAEDATGVYRLGGVIGYTACLSYLAGFAYLLYTFGAAYNQIYNLRRSKGWKYFKPIRAVIEFMGPFKHYELDVPKRGATDEAFSPFGRFLAEGEVQRLREGASILLTGPGGEHLERTALAFMLGRMGKKETGNWVTADRHPWELWAIMLRAWGGLPDQFRRDFVFIDAYTPAFGYSDDIQRHKAIMIERQGFARVEARYFAGVHTGTSKAFNILKDREARAGKRVRRPGVMVYAGTSALADIEGREQFRIFWRHVLSSERNYGMLTLVLESDTTDPKLLAHLLACVDFAFELRPALRPEHAILISRVK